MDKPEALELAELFDRGSTTNALHRAAAAELRRLHQSETEGWRWAKECETEVKRLKEIIDELENDDPPSKPDVNQDLVEALEGLMPYIATQATGCYGDKCREPWCFSCNGTDDAFAAAEKGQDACAKAIEVLAKYKEQT